MLSKVLASISLFVFVSAFAQENVSIPPNMVTYNVPPLSVTVADRLQRYTETRAASLAGWQGNAMLIYTRFGENVQLHRVAGPMAYREQLTFLREPLSQVVTPRGGAKDQVILRWDVGGSEFRQLFLYDLSTGKSRMLSDGKSLYSNVIFSADEQSIIYVTTQRNGRNWDIHWQDFQGNSRALLETQDGYWYPIDWSRDGKRVLVKKRVSVNESTIYELDFASGELTPIIGHQDTMSVEAARYDGRGGVYFTADGQGEFLRLYHLELEGLQQRTISQSIDWDVEGFAISADYNKMAYFVNAAGVSQAFVMSLPDQQALPLPKLPVGIVTGVGFSPNGKQLALTLNTPTGPSDVYVTSFDKPSLVRWTASEVGGLDTKRFVEPELITYTSFDGREISAFLYRPNTPGPHPVVVSIHGGPEGQYRPYFSTTVQSYVNEMNVAYIAPNVRGSKGYGKSFLQLDNGKKREDSVRDIGSLLDWVDDQDDLNSERVAVIGGSYGGYMVLACMVHFGDRLVAAVDSVGISNFVTFLENTQPYRQDIRRVEYGDERDPDMRAFLQSIAPLNHVDKMTTPVLIIQGANDPRVPASESEQMRKALEAQGVPVWFLLAKDEGHSLRKKVNYSFRRVAQFQFLESYLNQE